MPPAFAANVTVTGAAFVLSKALRAIASRVSTTFADERKLSACESLSPVKKSKPTGLALPRSKLLLEAKLLKMMSACATEGVVNARVARAHVARSRVGQ